MRATLSALALAGAVSWGAQAQAAATYYFSDCQPGAAPGCVQGNDANDGKSPRSPKRRLESVAINALPAGSKLLLARGGVWVQDMLVLDNPRVTAEAPLVIDAYGRGERPWLQAPGVKNAVFMFGKYNNTSYDGGYTLRNLKLDGRGTGQWGLFLIHNLHHVTIEDSEITGFHIGIHSQARAPQGVNHVVIRRNVISRNKGMGILGQFNDSLIEDNLFEANNFSGSDYDHAIYLSGNEAGGRRNVVRGNTFRHNSVVDGVCKGGNVTMHGQMDGMLIEGNTIEQRASARSCWGISITSGYKTAEWFRNFVVRNNTVVNLGECAFCINASPGIVVENNRVFNDQKSPHVAVMITRGNRTPGDAEDRDAVVRGNVACFPSGASNQVAVRLASAAADVSDNLTLAGEAATRGVCAR
ncbi:right-handed parallel beta-helix repeat-containing protein [Piscinibacter gummiphilus]|uniref:Right-handed parallel beta-helix repeat-containing protein n=1 Tax=Piscinibacter gummiphilus TaxID=946333 RepID=A0ABZ0CVY9_9BURK|nr:right-handed parallel beta-helix repeat-containing protein [Piscinibacter gummiphilus]WOB07301.1 right-handed parallel beta-helix repeat-containing protein [Piscinibacter gummiphilus]